MNGQKKDFIAFFPVDDDDEDDVNVMVSYFVRLFFGRHFFFHKFRMHKKIGPKTAESVTIKGRSHQQITKLEEGKRQGQRQRQRQGEGEREI